MQDKVYILANGKALEAYASDRKDNIPVEARDHVKTFHKFFLPLILMIKSLKAMSQKHFIWLMTVQNGSMMI